MPAQPYAGGDFLARLVGSSTCALRVETPHPKAGWRERIGGSATRIESPGTAVLFEGEFYEVVEYRQRAGTRPHHYFLAPWDDRNPMRAPTELSVERCEAEARELRRRRRSVGLAITLRLLQPVVALIPGPVQEELERRYSFPAVRATTWSALLLGVLGSVTIATRLLDLAWASRFSPSSLLLGIYLLFESILRLISALRFGQPVGSLLGTVPYVVVAALMERARPGRERRRVRPKPSRDLLDRAVDHVRLLPQSVEGENTQPGLEIISLLPKDHWTLGRTAVRYQEQLYLPVERKELDTQPPQTRYRLEILEEGQFPSTCVDYSPYETQRLHRENVRRAHQTWIDTVPVLWGNLAPAIQRRLETIYGFEPRRFVKLSIVINLVMGLALAWGATTFFAEGRASLDHELALLLGLYLVGESLVRGYRLRQGELTGGLLGFVFGFIGRAMASADEEPDS